MIDTKKILVVIPARGGSKGVPRKNIKTLNQIPLIHYSIRLARTHFSDDQICVTTDDKDIIEACELIDYKPQFVRPDHLAADTSGMRDVILHAIEEYQNEEKKYEGLLLLQPTSPLRLQSQMNGFLSHIDDDMDMLISVNKSKVNPYFNLYTENESGYIQKCMQGNFQYRQALPDYWQINGAFYYFKIEALYRESISSLKKVKKYVMSEINSVDIDSPLDFFICDKLLAEGKVELDY